MYQKITLVGNLGRDPEMRYTPAGQAVCNMPVATNRRYTKSDGEQIEETVWFRVTAWGSQAENCHKYLRKGRQVMVEGRIVGDEFGNPKIWNKADGSPAASFEVNAQMVRFLGATNGSAGNGNGPMPEEEDEIPF